MIFKEKTLSFVFVFFIMLISGCNLKQTEKTSVDHENKQVSAYSEDIYEITQKMSAGKYYVNLLDNVELSDDVSIKVDELNILSQSSDCNIISQDQSGFMIATDNSRLCDYEYSVSSKDINSRLNGKTKGLSRVIVTSSPDNAELRPFGFVVYQSETVEINIENELAKVGDFTDLTGYVLDDDVLISPSDSDSSVTVDSETNTLNYTPALDVTGTEQILYSMHDNVGNILAGSIVITIGDKSRPGISIDDTISLENNVSVYEKTTIDLSPFVRNVDDDWQLIYVSAFNASVNLTDPQSFQNKSFDFETKSVGDYYVNTVVTDHHGGYDTSLIQVQVTDPAAASSWSNILHKISLFYAPLSLSDAQSQGVEISSTNYDSAVSTTMVTFNYEKAKNYCERNIGRLPEFDELQEMQAVENPSQRGWPLGLLYWTNDPNLLVSLTSGASSVPDGANNYYVTCVNEGGFSIDSQTTGSIVANGTETALVTTKLEFNGKPVANQVIYANVGQSNATIESNLETDERGMAVFHVTNTKSESVIVTLNYNGEERTSSAINFIADQSTAKLTVTTIVDNQSVNGGIDRVEAFLRDANENPISSRDIYFSSLSDQVKIDPELGNTDVDGKVISDITWLGSDHYQDQQVQIAATYTLPSSEEIQDATSVTFTKSEPIPVSIVLKLSPQEIVVGGQSSAQVTVYYDDRSSKLSDNESVVFSSSNKQVAVVGSNGIVTGVSEGTAEIRAVFNCGECASQLSDVSTIYVNAPAPTLNSIRVFPEEPVIKVGGQQQMYAIAKYSNDLSVEVTPTWTSSNSNFLFIDSKGKATGLRETSSGVYIIAQFEGITGFTQATVEPNRQLMGLDINGPKVGNVGDVLSYQVIAKYSDSSQSDVTSIAVWSSSNNTIMSPAETGKFVASSAGNTTVKAKYSGMEALQSVEIKPEQQPDMDIDGAIGSSDSDPTIRNSSHAYTIVGGIDNFFRKWVGQNCSRSVANANTRIPAPTGTKNYLSCRSVGSGYYGIIENNCTGTLEYNTTTSYCDDITSAESQAQWVKAIPKSLANEIQAGAF